MKGNLKSNSLEIPELLAIPDPAPFDENPVAASDYLMTSLLHREPAMLHAEFREGPVRWSIRDSAKTEACVAESKSLGEFRTLLARFGYHYMDVQLYGGHIRRIVTQNGREFVCEIFMSNQGQAGFWIQVYVRAFEPLDCGTPPSKMSDFMAATEMDLGRDNWKNLAPTSSFVHLIVYQAVADRADRIDFLLVDESSETGFQISERYGGKEHKHPSCPGRLYSPSLVVLCNHASVPYYGKGRVTGRIKTKNPASEWLLESDDLTKCIHLSRNINTQPATPGWIATA